MIFFYILGIAFLMVQVFIIGLIIKSIKGTAIVLDWEIVVVSIYLFSLAVFAAAMSSHDNPYYKAIDPMNMKCYSPFSGEHALTLGFFVFTFNISLVLVWARGKKLPPLALVFSLIFLLIGILVNGAILIQTTNHDVSSFGMNMGCDDQIFFMFAPLLGVIIGAWFLVKTMNTAYNETQNKVYANKYLNFIHSFISTNSRNPISIFILLLPVFFISTLILMLFGQDSDSIVKVFTETTTWQYSQRQHPPILDEHGHYLCTVAAVGDPKIVKPLRLGQRHGKTIIVNRQLLIANAFEELLQDFSPKMHRFVRKNYDTYGYNLSLKINTPQSSNLTYVLMKPLEWFFLICLYLFCSKPEEKINRQYK
jgi:hypothetical protein